MRMPLMGSDTLLLDPVGGYDWKGLGYNLVRSGISLGASFNCLQSDTTSSLLSVLY